VAEREISCVVWRHEGERIDVIYVDGEPDRLTGTRGVAAELAESVGLTVTPTPPGVERWVRT